MGIRDADALYRPRVWSRQVLHTWLVVRYYTLSRDVYTRIVLQRDLIPSPPTPRLSAAESISDRERSQKSGAI